VAEVEQRIDAGSLIEPANDSAVVRFREAQSIGGGDPLVRGARDALVGALLTAADRELSADRALEARRFVEAAGTVNSSAPGLDFVRRRIDEALLQLAARSITPAVTAPAVVAPAVVTTPPAASSPPAQQPTAVQPTPPPAAAATATPPASAPSASTDGNAVVSANSLRPVRRVAPDYPQQALQNLVSGWVELEFTVAKDGSVRDVTVLDSEPGRTFDAAAVAALRRYRYEPVLLDGVPVEQRARLRMRFAAQDNR
jgi:TonB family protein